MFKFIKFKIINYKYSLLGTNNDNKKTKKN